jgi:ribosomal protein S27E
MRARGVAILSMLVFAAFCLGADSGKNGRISGSVTPVGKVRSITAIPRFLEVTCGTCKRHFTARANTPGGTITCRGCGKSFPVPTYAARIDATNGTFEITGLPVAQRYDLIVETSLGRIEGVDLAPFETDLERLRRKPIQANPRDFSEEDRASVTELIGKVKQFENFVRPIYIVGHADKATALLEKARIQDSQTGQFHSEQGNEAIWRVEVWYFRKWFGGWERVSNAEAVLYRKRMPRPAYDAMNWVFSDRLGGIEVDRAGTSPVLNISVPEQLDPNLGRVATARPAGS